MMLRVSIIVALALGCVACARQRALAPDAVRQQVVAAATAIVGEPAASATCPAMPAKRGTTHRCVVTFEGGGVLPFEVRLLDDAGALEIRATSPWLRGREIATSVTQDFAAIGETRQVRCSDAVIAVDGATTYACTGVQVTVSAAGVVSMAAE